ncbi:NAD(P)-dependent oxidoreductase [Haliea sp. E1-2-M8]|uniref:NAD(P)-dependent oxidoreductase n=1 Tax=Haliea sp. E1-2-M8 TaxID=3064706 RepID=UPI00272927BE|nr:NAD(P)-dependent oxidoreductase [Haliea sp. E1-2-M8]MDO8861983.1 NAD(P)-dependent oxidoreductase [Haliea sp. E1-2-M8]
MRLLTDLRLPDLHARIAACAPGLEIVQIDAKAGVPDGLRGDALFTTAIPGPHLEALLAPEVGVRWIHLYGTGVDGFPLHLVGDRELTCSRGSTATAIAEWVLAMLLADAKQLPASWVDSPPAHWYFASLQVLAGKQLGLVGLGAIGSAVARRAQAFEMSVSALVRSPRTLPAGIQRADDIEALLAGSDYLVLAAPATAATQHLLDRARLAQARPGLRLVNVARGSLVDHDALRWALDEGIVAHAYLDTAEPEPVPAGHWLYTHPGVSLSPHISWCEPDAMERVLALFFANLERFLRDEPLAGRVDVNAGY